jgi:hypothetical protein
MNTGALITMVLTQGIVTSLQSIFSISIDYSAKTGTRPFSENDEEEVRQDAENK